MAPTFLEVLIANWRGSEGCSWTGDVKGEFNVVWLIVVGRIDYLKRALMYDAKWRWTI
jgi:hypothetical protein